MRRTSNSHPISFYLQSFLLSNTSKTERYSARAGGGGDKKLPELNRESHGRALLDQLSTVKKIAEEVKSQQQAGMASGFGLQIQFSSFPDVELAIQRLDTSGFELRNVRHGEHHTYATVFVPDGKLDLFEQKIQSYLTENSKKGEPRNKALINTISEIRVAVFNSLWTDDETALPVSEQEAIWWEVWLPVLNDRAATNHNFRSIAEQIGFQLSPDELHFPERSVLLMYGTQQQIQQSIMLLNSIAELKRAKETAEFFDSLKPTDQREWIDDLLKHGYLTIDAVAQSESREPYRQRIFSMAVTAKDSRDRGKPSAWSATLDRLACDVDGEGHTPRLMIVSAGNIDDINAWNTYPSSNSTDSIHDPAQAWNVLTVGAFTEKIHITETDTQGYKAVAPSGGLSPFSTTSRTWQKHWPLKPDIVFEGGNAAKDAIGSVKMHSLSLLTTSHDLINRLLTTTNATSAATALCSRMAAQLMAQYPKLWPETMRALIVHSAEWTEQMKADYLPSQRKEDYQHLIRHCGFGVPNLERALWSASNSLTLIVQDELQPFECQKGSDPKMREMHLHDLPWPKETLEGLGETPVEMRVTLSYFIEPSPGIIERGAGGRYKYESHGLRFEAKRPEETRDTFRARINQRVRDEEEGSYSGGGSDPNWRLGTKLRHLGSLHSDTWTGTAAALAERGVLAVYPVAGWWKNRKKLERYHKQARYALIISIRTPETNVDIYSAIENLIMIKT